MVMYIDADRGFLQQIAKHPILSKEDTNVLILRWQENQDKKACDKLVLYNIRLVLKIAYKYNKHPFTVAELIAPGVEGLMKAIAQFDVSRSNALSTYATWWIKSKI